MVLNYIVGVWKIFWFGVNYNSISAIVHLPSKIAQIVEEHLDETSKPVKIVEARILVEIFHPCLLKSLMHIQLIKIVEAYI